MVIGILHLTIDTEDFMDRFGIRIEELYPGHIDALIGNGFLKNREHTVRDREGEIVHFKYQQIIFRCRV